VIKMNKDTALDLLQELLSCHAPPGDEAEIDAIILREFEQTSAEVSQDEAGNIYAHIVGDGPQVMVAAHKDEIGMVITNVRDDGRLDVQNIGGSIPWKYGEGAVDILCGDGSILRAILSVGGVHTLTGPVPELINDRALKWDDVTLFTGLSKSETMAKGIHAGTRAVVARERKQIQRVGEYIASYALDNRMGVVSIILALRELHDAKLPLDLHIVATTQEEVGLIGAIHAAQVLQPDIAIALDTSPVVHGVPAVMDERPIIWYKEAVYHNKTECDTLLRMADELGFGAQPILYNRAASDAGGIKRTGLASRTVAFGYPRDNSHGYEISHQDCLLNVTQLLIEYLKQLV
jgi:putative aminopeptidase FrvX